MKRIKLSKLIALYIQKWLELIIIIFHCCVWCFAKDFGYKLYLYVAWHIRHVTSYIFHWTYSISRPTLFVAITQSVAHVQKKLKNPRIATIEEFKKQITRFGRWLRRSCRISIINYSKNKSRVIHCVNQTNYHKNANFWFFLNKG